VGNHKGGLHNGPPGGPTLMSDWTGDTPGRLGGHSWPGSWRWHWRVGGVLRLQARVWAGWMTVHLFVGVWRNFGLIYHRVNDMLENCKGSVIGTGFLSVFQIKIFKSDYFRINFDNWSRYKGFLKAVANKRCIFKWALRIMNWCWLIYFALTTVLWLIDKLGYVRFKKCGWPDLSKRH